MASGVGRKIGRMARKPSHTRYNNEKRWITNKAKKIKAQAKKEEKAQAKKAKREAKNG